MSDIRLEDAFDANGNAPQTTEELDRMRAELEQKFTEIQGILKIDSNDTIQ